MAEGKKGNELSTWFPINSVKDVVHKPCHSHEKVHYVKPYDCEEQSQTQAFI